MYQLNVIMKHYPIYYGSLPIFAPATEEVGLYHVEDIAMPLLGDSRGDDGTGVFLPSGGSPFSLYLSIIDSSRVGNSSVNM